MSNDKTPNMIPNWVIKGVLCPYPGGTGHYLSMGIMADSVKFNEENLICEMVEPKLVPSIKGAFEPHCLCWEIDSRWIPMLELFTDEMKVLLAHEVMTQAQFYTPPRSSTDPHEQKLRARGLEIIKWWRKAKYAAAKRAWNEKVKR